MATYKVVDAEQLDADLAAVADGIRSISGNTATMSFPSGFQAEMDNANAEIAAQNDLIAQIKAALEETTPPRLPKGYTEVAWIESTGEQYIDWDVSVQHASEKIIVGFSPTEAFTDNVICGHAAPSWSWDTNLAFVTDEKVWVSGTYGISAVQIIVGNFYTLEYTKTACVINGVNVETADAPYTDGYNNTLFYASTKYGKQRVSFYTLMNGKTAVRDAVPCINPNGKAGMYDLADGVFYGNAGTGEFIAGPEV